VRRYVQHCAVALCGAVELHAPDSETPVELLPDTLAQSVADAEAELVGAF